MVDYKTDQLDGEAELDERADRYRLQLAAYALAVQRVTGEEVARAMLVFCSRVGGRRRNVRFLSWRRRWPRWSTGSSQRQPERPRSRSLEEHQHRQQPQAR